MRKVFATAVVSLAAAVGISGCGGSPKPTQALKDNHPCTANNYYMQCAANAKGQRLGHFLLSPGQQFGIDFAWGGPSGFTAKADGARFGASYLSFSSKDWTASKLASYRAAGIGTVFVWEQSANQSLGGFNAGRSVASAANSEARSLGYPNTPIFFAVDFDTTGYSVGGVITQYFRGIASVLGHDRAGVYGGLNTMRLALDNGVVKYGWQTLAWSFGQWDPRALLRQYGINNSWHGFSVDFNVALAPNYGQANYVAPKPVPPPPNYHYSWFAAGPFSSPYGNLRERLIVERYDGARKHPVKYRVYLKKLKKELRYLARRDYHVAILSTKSCVNVCGTNWAKFHRGFRFQQLSGRANGKQYVK